MKNWIKNNWYQAGIIAALSLIAVGVFYSLALRPIMKSSNLNQCLSVSQQKFEDLWDSVCKSDQERVINNCLRNLQTDIYCRNAPKTTGNQLPGSSLWEYNQCTSPSNENGYWESNPEYQSRKSTCYSQISNTCTNPYGGVLAEETLEKEKSECYKKYK